METIDQLSPAQFDKFTAQHGELNFLQSTIWADLHASLGYTIIRVGVRRGNKLVAVWIGIVKDARRGRYLEVPGGPVLDWSDEELSAYTVATMRQVGKDNACVFVRFRPQLEQAQAISQRLERLGTRASPMHLHAEHTNIVDLSQSEETLLKNMRRQTRYEVRRAGKRGVVVSRSRPSVAEIEEFFAVQSETARRHNFIPPSKDFLMAARQSLGDDLSLYRASKDGQLLNLGLIIDWGEEADYYEAASTPEARKEPGAYGLVWQAMQDAKAAGKQRFNLWGIAYSDNPHHRYAGVTTFKRGFGGQDVTYLPAHDIVIKRFRYLLNQTVETIRRKKRGL